MYLSCVLCLLMFVTSVLTSVTKRETTLGENNSTARIVDKVLKDSVDASKVSFKKNLSTEKIDKSAISNASQFIMEGGGKVDIAVSTAKFATPLPEKNASHLTMNANQETKKIDNNSKDLMDQNELEQKKSNIKPRKGVGNETLASVEEKSLENEKLSTKVNKTISNPMKKSETSTVKIPVNSKNETQHLPAVTVKTPRKNSTEKVKKHKLKPSVTIGGTNVDKPIPASPTKSPPLGMPRKIDYIVPIMITIVTVPLLSVATYILYRRGRDCWDKRHYRRMDFLIDGMYNE